MVSGTEYAVGRYDSVPIAGDGEGGFVSLIVENTTDDEGVTIPGQIVSATVTSPGKGYTTASIDVESIDGILGAGLTGSGADLQAVILPAQVQQSSRKALTLVRLRNSEE